MNYNGLEATERWFEQAIPNPTQEQACKQVGCHLEEVSEMAESIGEHELSSKISIHANFYKKEVGSILMDFNDKEALLDSLADQIVTAVGVAHMFGMDILGALEEVNRSNFSKFEDGKPVFDENGKISKGKYYSKPNLKPHI